MTTETENLRRKVDEVALQEEELFRKRQELIHGALLEERHVGLRETYLSIRAAEADLRCEHLRLMNLLQPGHSFHDHGGDFGPEKVGRKYIYLVVIAASVLGLLFLLARL